MRTNKMVEMKTFQTLADTCAGGVDLDKGKKVVAIVCGRNIDLEVFKRIIL